MPGRGMTHDKSRVAGWYNSPITCGPEPKPIRTGATLLSLAIAFVPLAGYKMHAQTFGGKKQWRLGDAAPELQHHSKMGLSDVAHD